MADLMRSLFHPESSLTTLKNSTDSGGVKEKSRRKVRFFGWKRPRQSNRLLKNYPKSKDQLNHWPEKTFKGVINNEFNNFLDVAPLTLSFILNRFVVANSVSELDFHETNYTYWVTNRLVNGHNPASGAGSPARLRRPEGQSAGAGTNGVDSQTYRAGSKRQPVSDGAGTRSFGA